MSERSIYSYMSYREYLSDKISEMGFSYREFIKRYSAFISLNALAKLLSTGRTGNRKDNGYRISPEALARLGKAIKMSDEELTHLLLLRLENDADTFPGPHGSSFKRLMGKLLQEHKEAAARGTSPQGSTNPEISQTASALSDLISQLPATYRLKIAEECLTQAKVYMTRQSGKAGLEALHSTANRLKELIRLGAP